MRRSNDEKEMYHNLCSIICLFLFIGLTKSAPVISVDMNTVLPGIQNNRLIPSGSAIIEFGTVGISEVSHIVRRLDKQRERGKALKKKIKSVEEILSNRQV